MPEQTEVDVLGGATRTLVHALVQYNRIHNLLRQPVQVWKQLPDVRDLRCVVVDGAGRIRMYLEMILVIRPRVMAWGERRQLSHERQRGKAPSTQSARHEAQRG